MKLHIWKSYIQVYIWELYKTHMRIVYKGNYIRMTCGEIGLVIDNQQSQLPIDAVWVTNMIALPTQAECLSCMTPNIAYLAQLIDLPTWPIPYPSCMSEEYPSWWTDQKTCTNNLMLCILWLSYMTTSILTYLPLQAD